MKIEKIQVLNYRQFENTTLSMNDGITVLAGANNSGKTALVELLKNAFGKEKGQFTKDDFSVVAVMLWAEQIYPIWKSVFETGKSKEEILKNLSEVIVPSDKDTKGILIEPITVKIEVTYNPDTDDIRKFADYIMDFSPDTYSFYFIYQYGLSSTLFLKSLESKYENLRVGFLSTESHAIARQKERLISFYNNCSQETCLYCDGLYTNIAQVECKDFKSLFNFCSIMAMRPLDDQKNDNTHTVSSQMIELASRADTWKELVRDLPNQIVKPIDESPIKDTIKKTSLDSLKGAINEISKTNGGYTGEIILDTDVNEDNVSQLLKNATTAKYQFDKYFLKESSQGLGYSNLVYIHLQLELYKTTINPFLVNIFIIEEPESHMHPQMQKVFMKYLSQYYENQCMQGLITTHSCEMVQSSEMKRLRVVRQTGKLQSRLFDFAVFLKDIKEDLELTALLNNIFSINYSEIIFADKVIMYEGDTERMLIRHILHLPEYSELNNQYIAYIQVGGAYAYSYKKMIEFLEMKTLIITDLDYDKEAVSEDTILASESTNATINNLYHEEVVKDEQPTIKELYKWKKTNEPLLCGKYICLAFQGSEDNLSRTLEEAMLSLYYKTTAICGKVKKDWTTLKSNDKLKYTVPQKRDKKPIKEEDLICLREIVQHTSNGKTDFMYSVILNNKVGEMLPSYIKEGLVWLKK